MSRRDNLDVLPFSDYADPDPHGKLRIGDGWTPPANPAPAAQVAAGCGDGHDPASATGVCVRCGYDVLGYWEDFR